MADVPNTNVATVAAYVAEGSTALAGAPQVAYDLTGMSLKRKIMQVAAKLEKVDRQRRELQAEFDRLLAEHAATPNGQAFDGGDGSPSRVKALLDGNPDRTYTAQEAAAALDAPVVTVRSTLARLFRSHEIAKAERGKYRSSHHASTSRFSAKDDPFEDEKAEKQRYDGSEDDDGGDDDIGPPPEPDEDIPF